MHIDLTPEERRAIAAFERLARRWPSSLMVIAGSGNLVVIRTEDYTTGRFLGSGGEDVLAEIGIPSDGGDPW